MRIYSTGLIAAVALIASISSCSASGSKTAPSDPHTSDTSYGYEDGFADGIVHSNDEEDRMLLPSKIPAFIGATGQTFHDIAGSAISTAAARDRFTQLRDSPLAQPLMERLESSGKLLPELDLISRVGEESPESSGTATNTHSHSQDHPRQAFDLISLVGKGQGHPRQAFDLISLVGKGQDHPRQAIDLISPAKINQSPIVAPRSDADSKRVTKHALVVAPRSDADSTRIVEHALVVTPLSKDERTRIITKLQEQTDPKAVSEDKWMLLKEKETKDPNAEQLMRELVDTYGVTSDDFTALASALRSAKADGNIEENHAKAMEDTMLEIWRENDITLEQSFDILELSDLEQRGGMTDENLRLFEHYLTVSPERRNPGDRTNVYSFIRWRFKSKKDCTFLRMIVQAGEKSIVAKKMLAYLVKAWVSKPVPSSNIIDRLALAQVSESMVQYLLRTNHEGKHVTSIGKDRWTEFVTALDMTLKSNWKKAVETALEKSKSSSNPNANELMRNKRTNRRREAAPARQERALKRQKVTKPSIRR